MAAADLNWVIGKDDRPLVTIPADRQLFLKETAGRVVVTGRKTLEALPGGQPFAGRTHVVLTRDLSYKKKGAVICHSLEEALQVLSQYDSDDIFIAGGESIYRQFLPWCTTAHITRIDYKYDGNRVLPDLEQEGFVLTRESEEQTYFDLCYSFQEYTARKKQL